MTKFRVLPVNRFLLALAVAGMALPSFCQPGSITGIVVDASGASIARAQVRLFLDGRGPDQETRSTDSGTFSFSNVAPGSYRLAFTANSFAAKTLSGEIQPGETVNLPPAALALDTVTTEVIVTQTQAEIAEAQVKVAETQRFAGLVPNYFVNYDPDAVPLNAKQKLELTWKTYLDPSAFVINGIIAGVWQAQNTNKGFGQGAQGYAKRYGAAFADYGTALMLEKFVMPTIFKQDPRYFFKGTGTKRSRLLYAISRSVICRGDNKRDQFCYSSFLNRFASGFLTNYYYPAADRNSSLDVVRGAAIGIGADALGNVFQEFVARKITRRKQ
jgi:hypothetical protein